MHGEERGGGQSLYPGLNYTLKLTVGVGLGASSIGARQGSPVKAKQPKGRQQSQRQLLLLLLGVPHEDQAICLWYMCREHSGWPFSLSEPLGAQVN